MKWEFNDQEFQASNLEEATDYVSRVLRVEERGFDPGWGPLYRVISTKKFAYKLKLSLRAERDHDSDEKILYSNES
jgi:hypothetical protein